MACSARYSRELTPKKRAMANISLNALFRRVYPFILSVPSSPLPLLSPQSQTTSVQVGPLTTCDLDPGSPSPHVPYCTILHLCGPARSSGRNLKVSTGKTFAICSCSLRVTGWRGHCARGICVRMCVLYARLVDRRSGSAVSGRSSEH